jgi:hypothetical protein
VDFAHQRQSDVLKGSAPRGRLGDDLSRRSFRRIQRLDGGAAGFKVQTSGFSAEYGRTGGGVFNFVMRPGANQVHGTGFGTVRNEALNAKYIPQRGRRPSEAA